MAPRWVTKRRGRNGWTWGIDGMFAVCFSGTALLIVYCIYRIVMAA